MFRCNLTARLAVVIVIFSLSGLHTQAQQTSEPPTKSATPTSEEIKPEQSDKPIHAYRVDFSIYELEDGKKINSRHYSMNVNSGDRNEVEISAGTSVSNQATGEASTVNEAEFLNVKTHIYCRVREHGDEVLLSAESVISNVLSPPHTRPINRVIDIIGSTVVTFGKPVMLGSVDDPASNREFQLEVTAARLK
jgi:hypothetical protein